MSARAGQLLWRRMLVSFPEETLNVTIDTGIKQTNLGVDPPLGFTAPDIASRVQVIPLSPMANWDTIAHGEPFIDPITGTINITFFYTGTVPEPPTPPPTPNPVNVLIWDPHTMVSPGLADTYQEPEPT